MLNIYILESFFSEPLTVTEDQNNFLVYEMKFSRKNILYYFAYFEATGLFEIRLTHLSEGEISFPILAFLVKCNYLELKDLLEGELRLHFINPQDSIKSVRVCIERRGEDFLINPTPSINDE